MLLTVILKYGKLFMVIVMARNRRNKRIIKRITEVIDLKTFLIIMAILFVIIVASIGIIKFRNYQDSLELASQKEELDKQIEAIFEETERSIDSSNSTVRDEIIRVSAVR